MCKKSYEAYVQLILPNSKILYNVQARWLYPAAMQRPDSHRGATLPGAGAGAARAPCAAAARSPRNSGQFPGTARC